MESKAVAGRDPWIDNIKGILMILVVVGHMSASVVKYSGAIGLIYNLINSFHMPCFMFVTGFMSQRRIKTKDYGRMVTRLIIPYFSAQFLIYVAAGLYPNAFSQMSYQTSQQLNWLFPNYHLWFLCAVILFDLVTPTLYEIFRRRPALLFVLGFACSMLVGFCPQIYYLRLTKCISYYPLFLAGFLCRKEWFYALRDKKALKPVGAAILAVWVAAFAIWQDWINPKIFSMATPYQGYTGRFAGLYPIVGRVLFLVCSLLVAFAFMTLVTKRKTIVSFIGKNSMIVYVLHGIIVIYLRTFNNDTMQIWSRINTPVRKLIFLALCVALTFVLASPPVVRVFGKILEPKIDLKKMFGSKES